MPFDVTFKPEPTKRSLGRDFPVLQAGDYPVQSPDEKPA